MFNINFNKKIDINSFQYKQKMFYLKQSINSYNIMTSKLKKNYKQNIVNNNIIFIYNNNNDNN